jgi:hypothetical protein
MNLPSASTPEARASLLNSIDCQILSEKELLKLIAKAVVSANPSGEVRRVSIYNELSSSFLQDSSDPNPTGFQEFNFGNAYAFSIETSDTFEGYIQGAHFANGQAISINSVGISGDGYMVETPRIVRQQGSFMIILLK